MKLLLAKLLLLSCQWHGLVAAQAPSNCEPKAGILVPEVVVSHLLDLITLIQITREDDPTIRARPAQFASMHVFCDSNDCAIVARRDNTCMAVFQATDFGNPLDIAQLVNWETETVGGCTFRAGMASAYFSSYHDDFVQAVDNCMATTTPMHVKPKLLLGGHSQGGAISVVASVDLHRYNPTVVTLGAVRSLVQPCNVTTPRNHYRFVNAINGAYDFWTSVFNRNGMHIGHPIYMDPTAQPGYMASSTFLNDDGNFEPTDTYNHDPDIYWLSISQLFHENLANGCDDDELVIGGWENGHFCNIGSECSGRRCVDNSCQPRKQLGGR